MELANDTSKALAQVIEKLRSILGVDRCNDDDINECLIILESALDKLLVKM